MNADWNTFKTPSLYKNMKQGLYLSTGGSGVISLDACLKDPKGMGACTLNFIYQSEKHKFVCCSY